jgi:hypothetical protein
MEQSKVHSPLTIVACAAFLILCGCVNPFAPSIRNGASSTPWTDASTVGGMLENFKLSYELGDSLQYADLLDEQFQFQYYDPELQRTEGWLRETDLRTTTRLFRGFHNISLIWGELPTEIEQISASDSSVDLRVQYQLILDELSPLIGFARFTLNKPAGQKFRIVIWRDDF